MKRAILALAASTLLLVGCSSTTADTVAESPAVAETSESPTPEPAATTAPPVLDAVSAATAAGATCAPTSNLDEYDCTLNLVEFRLANAGWDGLADARADACEMGYINENFQVLTNGEWYASTSMVKDLVGINTALASQNLNGTVQRYCP